MSAPILLNLLNELRKRDKMQGAKLPSFLSLFCNEFINSINAGAGMLKSIYPPCRTRVN